MRVFAACLTSVRVFVDVVLLVASHIVVVVGLLKGYHSIGSGTSAARILATSAPAA